MTPLENQRQSIALLPPGLVNKIAAGEVVERPASVVKELLENSLDAGATMLRVDIVDGGRTLIRIADNGGGIPAAEIPLAFAQHATSKIRTSEDLFAIATMGFRGEALASIASVSHVTMLTRQAEQANGNSVEVRDSVLGPITPCACAVGTIIEVRDLFYSVPARRKFMRSDATEFSHCHEMLLRVALPNPHVGFVLTHNGRTVTDLPPTTDHRKRVAAALGDELYDLFLPVDFDERGVRITGFVGKPELARATSKLQYLFLNGRFIRDRSLLHAVKESYRGLIEPSAQPVAVVFMEMAPDSFDVNVHPQKTEVRFRESNGPYRNVLAAVREKLLGTDLTPHMRVRGESTPTDPEPATPNEVTTPSTKDMLADFWRAAPVEQRPLEYASLSPAPPVPTCPQAPMLQREAIPPATESPAVPPPAPDNHGIKHVAQFHNTYIVAETEEGILILDQHALHERIIYQEMFARATSGKLESQRLLLPEIISLTPRHQAVLEQVQPLLEKLGVEYTQLDQGAIAIQSFPTLMYRARPHEFIRELLDKLLEVGSRLTQEELLHEVLDMASCKAAIKAGMPLSEGEMRALLIRRDQTERGSNCPHGRPTTLRFTIAELEKQFKRR
jgi:DNA mismatch repair protein MutL